VILLSGFLGSGKTTFINYILQSGLNLSDVVIIANEFGKLGIDGALILHQDNEIVELTSGWDIDINAMLNALRNCLDREVDKISNN